MNISRRKPVGFHDRAAGVLIGLACGDALGAGYEFGGPIPASTPIGMVGGGAFDWEPGEWTDDTSMAIPIAREVAAGADLLDPETLGRIVGAWKQWARDATDVGVQTSTVLRGITTASESEARKVSEAVHQASQRSGGNGALMRTAPVALAYLDDPAGLSEGARRIAQLTHWDEDAGDACVLWCHAIRHAVVSGELNIRVGLDQLSTEKAVLWGERILEAEATQPDSFFATNGWVVTAFQGAWSAIHHGAGVVGSNAGEGSAGDGSTLPSIVVVLERAVRGGGDTDTVAAIVGSLIGAAVGVSRIPAAWRRIIHGWPGMRYRDLLNLGVVCASGIPAAQTRGWPLAAVMPGTYENVFVQHPHDDGVWLGSLTALETLPDNIDVVVSMCRVGTEQVRGIELIEFWLIDDAGRNLDTRFVLTDAANTVASLRAEGKNVLIHCVAAHNRTPAAGIAYSILHKGVSYARANAEVRAALPNPQYNAEFEHVLRAL